MKAWMQTFTGRAFPVLEPTAADVSVVDIAYGLAFQSRFNGHTRRYYSIAQHCVLVSEIFEGMAPEFIWGNEFHEFTPREWGLVGLALLHDAPEAYLGDIVRPVKLSIQGFEELEARAMRAILEALGFGGVLFVDAAERERAGRLLKLADRVALATERRDLMGPPPRPWESIESVEPWPMPLESLAPERAFIEWMARLDVIRSRFSNTRPGDWGDGQLELGLAASEMESPQPEPVHPEELDTLGKRHTITDLGDCVHWCKACKENERAGLNPDGTEVR